jgi:hypothetical protein
MAADDWVGFRYPARYLTEEEIDLLSPMCHSCDLTATIVELQVPLTDELAKTSVLDIPDNQLKYWCAHHSPMEVSDEAFDEADLERYEQFKTQIYCPKYLHNKVVVTCLRYPHKCVSSCEAIKRKLNGMSLSHAKRIAEMGWQRYLADKAAKNGKDHG